MEFHISREARKKYDIDQTLFSITGNAVLPNFHATRLFAQKLNAQKDLVKNPEKAVRPGQINAMGLIDEILHYVADVYREQESANVFQEAIDHLKKSVGEEEVEKTLLLFTQKFPSTAVMSGDKTAEQHLAEETSGITHKELSLEELLLLWVANKNPAFAPFYELFDDQTLETQSAYNKVINELYNFFEAKPKFGPNKENLMDMLRAPAIAVPDSLSGQLTWIRENWGMLLGKFLFRLLSSLDFLTEEEKLRGTGGGPGPTEVLEYGEMDEEIERFSPDKDWMPNVVMIAKSTLVWLDQLSKEYKIPITRLDQVPDGEIDRLARAGFTALWLIGLWERSKASKRIKQMCGNPEAEASAYALHEYEIAQELGGWEALGHLRRRCWKRGIRLASDMVPNHTGIDSKWINEHPDWFLQLDYPPYPTYSFNGENLSSTPGVGVYIEDHYYSREDAAVVFKRVDFDSGRERFIYHGNDGTSMPWNDTAQLNYLDPRVREAVIQTILHVARNFPVIRFDAAMTLAKKHYQRLWFPQPGSGGDIPTRAEHGMTKDEFDAAMPVEFWREVVDRVAEEVPDTLLLAEAFWFMEGYFVRTLGMHRVYNSAFMNMLKNEENAKYRHTIKNTIEFDPDILKRFVNFMNNPDEDTAVAQFGKGDKYFGVCTMMITMPGLPMFGHGQIEGYSEKYGMEYRKAYWNEEADQHLIERHEQQIFPLIKKRSLFADVRNFLLYDFYATDGTVNENVFAYSNSDGNDRALVLYNNAFDQTMGWIRTSAAYTEKGGNGEKQRKQKSLGEGLNLHNDGRYYTIFRDVRSDLWYIRNSKELCDKGMYAELSGYETHVFLDVYEVQENNYNHYSQLAGMLGGKGTPNINEALKEVFLKPLHDSMERFLTAELFQDLISKKTREKTLTKFEEDAVVFLERAKDFAYGTGDEKETAVSLRNAVEAALLTIDLSDTMEGIDVKGINSAVKQLTTDLKDSKSAQYTLIAWAIAYGLGELITPGGNGDKSRSLWDEWLLAREYRIIFTGLKMPEDTIQQALEVMKILITQQNWFKAEAKKKDRASVTLTKIFRDEEVRNFIGENRYNEILWYNKEKFESLAWWLYAAGVSRILESAETDKEKKAKEITSLHSIYKSWSSAADKSEYKVEKLFDQLGGRKDEDKTKKKKPAETKEKPKKKKKK
ncbi:MAG: alpha-amylase family glycosyl hydrolase [Spirochaetia bacterium]